MMSIENQTQLEWQSFLGSRLTKYSCAVLHSNVRAKILIDTSFTRRKPKRKTKRKTKDEKRKKKKTKKKTTVEWAKQLLLNHNKRVAYIPLLPQKHATPGAIEGVCLLLVTSCQSAWSNVTSEHQSLFEFSTATIIVNQGKRWRQVSRRAEKSAQQNLKFHLLCIHTQYIQTTEWR